MKNILSRRDFLKLSAGTAGIFGTKSLNDWLLPGEGWSEEPIGVGRITVDDVDFFLEPDVESPIIRKKNKDEFFPIFEDLAPPDAIPATPRWYRTDYGYIFSMYTQRVEGRHLNEPVAYVPEEGWLGEITVPFTRTYRKLSGDKWVPVYRLYYESVHWITGIDEGPDGRPWYKLTDELLHVDYLIPATHMRIVKPEELTPISPDVPFEKKHIEVSLIDQTLTAYENDEVVLHTFISSGIPGLNTSGVGFPTDTPRGRFNISVKMPSKHMGDGNLTDDIRAYELPGVPWVSFFTETGVALHGTYWHHNYGRRMSHGCVNMVTAEAKWIYRWTIPQADVYEWEKKGYGTQVTVR